MLTRLIREHNPQRSNHMLKKKHSQTYNSEYEQFTISGPVIYFLFLILYLASESRVVYKK